eukprot:705503_1
MNGFVLFALMMLVSPMNVMAAMDSKNASDGDHRNGEIQPATLEIIKNFTKKFSQFVQNIDVLQKNVNSRFNKFHLSAEQHRSAVVQFMHTLNPPDKNPVGSFRKSAADLANAVKSLRIPEVIIVWNEYYDNMLKALLNRKFEARAQWFRIRSLENNPKEPIGERDLDCESTKAVLKLLGKQIYSLPESCQSAILNMLPSSGAENECKTNYESGPYTSTSRYGYVQSPQKDARMIAKQQKLKNKKKKKSASGFHNSRRSKNKKIEKKDKVNKTHYSV